MVWVCSLIGGGPGVQLISCIWATIALIDHFSYTFSYRPFIPSYISGTQVRYVHTGIKYGTVFGWANLNEVALCYYYGLAKWNRIEYGHWGRPLRFFITGLKLYGDQTCSCPLVPFNWWHACLLSCSNMSLLQYTFANGPLIPLYLQGRGDTSGGCRCRVGGKKCHPLCRNCHWSKTYMCTTCVTWYFLLLLYVVLGCI